MARLEYIFDMFLPQRWNIEQGDQLFAFKNTEKQSPLFMTQEISLIYHQIEQY